jgi:hypothetical protein
MNKQLEFPVGSFISWCGEFFKVITNNDDWKGIVADMNNDKAEFYFTYGREKAELITDEEQIKELEEYLKQ